MLTLLPIMAVVLTAFLMGGLAMPVLPLHVHQSLGLGTVVVSLVAGSQFAASFVSWVWSGHYADSRGAKRAVVVGLLMAAASRLLYLLSLLFVSAPVLRSGWSRAGPAWARRLAPACSSCSAPQPSWCASLHAPSP